MPQRPPRDMHLTLELEYVQNIQSIPAYHIQQKCKCCNIKHKLVFRLHRLCVFACVFLTYFSMSLNSRANAKNRQPQITHTGLQPADLRPRGWMSAHIQAMELRQHTRRRNTQGVRTALELEVVFVNRIASTTS
jgi:hypothetical protein